MECVFKSCIFVKQKLNEMNSTIKRKRKKVINKVRVYSTLWYNESFIKEFLERQKSSPIPNFVSQMY